MTLRSSIRTQTRFTGWEPRRTPRCMKLRICAVRLGFTVYISHTKRGLLSTRRRTIMAGSYNHVVTDDGNLGSNQFVADMLENGGDVFEAVEEMYGMIWYLTHHLVKADDSLSEESLANYRKSMK